MLFVECKPDFVLATSLTLIPLKKVEHAGNKSRVLKKLTENYENSIGIIDEDPLSIQPPDIKKFKEIEYSEKSKVKILLYKRLKNRVIVLCPRLEEWIVEAAKEAKIDLNKYNFPSNPEKLHEIINIRTERFQDLIEELLKKSKRVKELQGQLKNIKKCKEGKRKS